MTKREKRELEKSKQTTAKKKFNFSAFHIKLISVIAVSLIFLLAVGFFVDSFAPANPKSYHRWLLSTFNGSYNKEGLPKTYMQIETKANNETAERATSYVWSTVSVTEGAGVNEIWVNVSDLYEEEVSIKVRTGKSESNTILLKTYKLSKQELKKSKDGWIKIYDLDNGDKPHTATYGQTFAIGFEAGIRLREIGFVGNGGYEVQIEECGTAIDDMVDAVTSKTEGSEVSKVCDEQKTFKYAPQPLEP